jgi:hypothetical protein
MLGDCMDPEEALNLFVSSHFKLLLAPEFSYAVYKREKLNFFTENKKNLHGVPKDKDIAEQAIKYLIKNGVICDDSKLAEVFGLPFFKENIHNKEQIVGTLHLQKSTIAIIDPKKLSQSRYRHRLRKEIKEEIIQEQKDVIDKAIERKKEEYELVPSVLDGTDFAEPIPEEQEPADEDRFVPWWKRLKLSQDPFPTQEGLAPLAVDLYEKIVFKTPIFEKYVYLANSEPGELFKDTIFFGEFGSGKTTLFDYLEKPLLIEKVFTIYIQLYAEQSFQTLLTNFRKKLYDGLCEKHQLLYKNDPHPWLGSSDFQEGIEKLLTNFSANEDIRGFVTIIDDLHKDSDAFELAMKFINNLQIFKGELVRQIKNLRLAFFVAGSAEWERTIKNDPKYSGSYARQETMPPVTEEAAYEMLNKRLAAFATNLETIRTIDIGFVKRIYRGLQNNKLPITFRSFIQAALSEFGNGNFSILTVDPVHISKEVIVDIRGILESNKILKKKFANLLFGGGIQKEENRKRCLELLVLTYLKNGITEDTRELRENSFGFQRLVRSQLMQKAKLFGDRFKWVICKELSEQNHIVLQRHNLSLEDYLVKIYITPVLMKAKKVEQISEELKRLDLVIKLLTNKEARNLAKASRTKHVHIIEEMDRFERLSDSGIIVRDCIESLALLTKAIARFMGLQIELTDDLPLLTDFWKDFWIRPGEISEFLNQCARFENERSNELGWYVCTLYCEAFSVLVKFFEDERDKSRIMVIPLAGLSNEEILWFREIREKWAKNEFIKVADLTVTIIGKKLGMFLFHVFELLYGDQENRLKNVDSSTRESILQKMKGDQEKGLGILRNEFEQVGRGSLKNFIVGTYGSPTGKQNWEFTFKRALSPLSEIELTRFLDISEQIDAAISQRKDNVANAEQQSRIHSFVLGALEITKRINMAYLLLLEKCLHVIETEGQARFTYYFSFSELKDKDRLSPIFVKPSNAERIAEQLIREKPLVKIDFEDSQTIESRFGIAYREFVTIIARLVKQSPAESKKTGLCVKIARSIGSTFTLFISKADN